MNLRLHRFLPRTAVEGPGLRACVWVQGCSIRCRGCFNPGTWPAAGGEVVSVDELAARIVATDGIEGVTFLGGEPFEQAAALAELGRRVRARGLSVMTFTGLVREEVEAAGRAEWDALLSVTDLLVDGPYVEELQDLSRPWVGSSNQRFHLLTDHYADLAGELEAIPNRLEVRVTREGAVHLNGMASRELLSALRRNLDAAPVR